MMVRFGIQCFEGGRLRMKTLTLGEASKLTGKSKPTISKACKDGRINHSINPDGSYKINVSEIKRVYPEVFSWINEDRVGDLCDFYAKIELAQQIIKLEVQVEGYKKLHEQSLKMLNLLGEE